MDRQQVALLHILISLSLQIIGPSFALNHFFIPEKEELFSECTDKPGYSFVDKLADLSRFNRKKDADGAVNISGNITIKWDVEPSSRIAVEVSVEKFEGGTWKPTAFNGGDRDFCKKFYDKNTIYYPFSTEHVINKQQVKDKCITTPGTVLVLEPFLLKILINFAVPLSPGRHKAVIIFSAFDKSGVKLPRDICIEIVGEIVNI
ncbi:uncharacterized protein LOC6614345 [Drosophila sechellia]|uniref:GM10426 n=1 Tax=Drosophila sechellia TaxID=7238 RepID=B4I3F7_DROSE|nr:uncharacterized protein LOC6614345 [Drosophila sechellia]EDW55321.1 GM10426 [Drosophila sechellia]